MNRLLKCNCFYTKATLVFLYLSSFSGFKDSFNSLALFLRNSTLYLHEALARQI